MIVPSTVIVGIVMFVVGVGVVVVAVVLKSKMVFVSNILHVF